MHGDKLLYKAISINDDPNSEIDTSIIGFIKYALRYYLESIPYICNMASPSILL